MNTSIEERTRRTRWFSHDRFGMFIHWGIYSIPARGEWVRSREQISVEDYQPFFEEFNPVFFDAKKWARLAREAGMKYAVLTAKHHDGFCLFDSALTDYKATNTPCGRDLVREYVEAFRAEGLKVGLYYSLLDWHHPDYPHYGDRHHPMRNHPECSNENRDFNRYLEYMHGQVRELLTNYGKIDIMWFDFSYPGMECETWKATELVEMARSLQPDLIIANRLEGSGHHFKSSRMLIRSLVECVSKGGNLLLNVGPDAKGRIPDESVAILKDFAAWMKDNSDSIYGCGYSELPKPEWGRFTQKGKKLYAHIYEECMGAICLPGLAGKVDHLRLLKDGCELKITEFWNIKEYPNDAFFFLSTSRNLTFPLPDEKDTVVEITLK